MRTHTGVDERMFAALDAERINIKMITTGDIKISVLVDKADGVRALRAVHQAFHLHEPRAGAGKNGRGGPGHYPKRRGDPTPKRRPPNLAPGLRNSAGREARCLGLFSP